MARPGGERSLNSLPAMPATQPNGRSAAASPTSPQESRIPRFTPSPTAPRRSASLRLRGERGVAGHQCNHKPHHQDLFPVITENGADTPTRSFSSLSLTPSRGRTRPRTSPGSGSGNTGLSEDCSDAESVRSFGSNYSTQSVCDHANFAFNGTTWSGRSHRYVVHCSSHASDSEEYLTPTQRAARQLRKFQSLWKEAKSEIDEKDREIQRLTKEVVELRLHKASLSSPDEKTDSSETTTIRENKPFSPESPSKNLPADDSLVPSLTSPRTPDKKESSLVDSGNFEDGSVHSKESMYLAIAAIASAAEVNDSCSSTTISALEAPRHDSLNLLPVPFQNDERKKIVNHYETRIEEMHRRHIDEMQLLKQNHNDKVESLLNQLSQISMRYCEVRPSLDAAEVRTKELEAELEALRTELNEQKSLLSDQEERNKLMYLKMYTKGQEAARIEQADQISEQAQKNSTKMSVTDLLQRLTVTEAELENTKPFQDSSYTPEPIVLANRTQSLLSIDEAVSLWVLGTRKVMYRRMMESKKNKPAQDPEITLQFLKSAVYYFLTDKENLHGHLSAIESILGFTDLEKLNIDRIYGSTRK